MTENFDSKTGNPQAEPTTPIVNQSYQPTNQNNLQNGHANGQITGQANQAIGHTVQPTVQHNGQANYANSQSTPATPVWDSQRRELRFGDTIVKRFKWPATNQERVLNAFQELGWPKNIDDPLEIDEKICPKRRLHDTLKCLNRKQLIGVIKFRGDGTGRGVLLEINKDKIE